MKFSIETLNDNGSGMVYTSKEDFLQEVSRMIDDCIRNKGTFFDIQVDSDASCFDMSKYLTVRDLNSEQYKQLCQSYITEFWSDFESNTKSPSLGDLEVADELVSEDVIYRYYDGVVFTNEDFI